MADEPWQKVREAFGSEPIVSQSLGGALNIHVERYICEPLSSAIEPLSSAVLVTQFGGSQVGEGQKNIFTRNSSQISQLLCQPIVPQNGNSAVLLILLYFILKSNPTKNFVS